MVNDTHTRRRRRSTFSILLRLIHEKEKIRLKKSKYGGVTRYSTVCGTVGFHIPLDTLSPVHTGTYKVEFNTVHFVESRQSRPCRFGPVHAGDKVDHIGNKVDHIGNKVDHIGDKVDGVGNNVDRDKL